MDIALLVYIYCTTLYSEDNGTEVLISLQDAFNRIQEAADEGEFTIDLQGDEYEIDRNLTSVSGQAICPPGLTRVDFYCGKSARINNKYGLGI